MAETNMKPTDLELKIKKLITLHVSLKTQIETILAEKKFQDPKIFTDLLKK